MKSSQRDRAAAAAIAIKGNGAAATEVIMPAVPVRRGEGTKEQGAGSMAAHFAGNPRYPNASPTISSEEVPPAAKDATGRYQRKTGQIRRDFGR